jgi:hydroxyacid-oxoacid transhydrogenase
MRDVGAPRGVAELGYTEDDIPELVAGAVAQERLLAGAPKPVGADDLRHIITASMTNW